MGQTEDINDLISDNIPVAEAPVDTPIEEPAPIVEEPVAEPTSDVPQESPAEPTGEPVPPPSEPPVEPAPSEDPRDVQIAQMTDTISALQKMVNDIAAAQAQPKAQAAVEDAPVAPIKFVESEDALDEALKTADNFNAMLSNAMQKMQEQFAAVAQQMAVQVAHGIYTQRAAADDFYRANQDLAANKAFVAMVADEMAAAHPDWDIMKVMEELAGEVRNRLHLGQTAPVAAPASDAPAPAFAGSSVARPSAGPTPTSSTQKEINDLIDGFFG